MSMRRLLGPFKEFGVGAGLLYTVDWLLRRLSPSLGLSVYELMAQPVVEVGLLPAALTKHLHFAAIGPDDVDITRVAPSPLVAAERFSNGALCLGAYRKGALLGYIWWCRRAYHEEEVGCTFVIDDDSRAVFDFDLQVLPEHRMGIGFMAIWHGANQVLHAQGVRASCSRISRFNTASLRAHVRLGAIQTGRAAYLRLGSARLMVSTAAPYVGLALRRGTSLKLRIEHRVD